jgi:hypothetical protein
VHFNWELSDHPPHSPDLTPSDYLQNWFTSQHFNSNEELMEGVVKLWLSSQAAHFFHTGKQKLTPQYDDATIPVVTMLRSSLSMCEFFV